MTKFKIYLYLSLGGLLFFALFLWQCTCGYSEFGLNFFTEILSIIITVFLIEILIRKIKEDENLPMQIAVYNEVNRFTSSHIRFLRDLYQKSITEDEPSRIEDLLSQEVARKVWDAVDMNASPLITPKTNMWTFLHGQIKSMHDKGNEILNRYSGHLDPKIHLLVHDLTNSALITAMLQSLLVLPSFDRQNKIPRPAVLSAYSIDPPEKYYSDLLALYYWCIEFHKKHKNEASISEPLRYTTSKDRKTFSYKKDEDLLKKEIEEYEAFQKKPRN